MIGITVALLFFVSSHIFGTESSSRNSEVIHAGIYYPHDSLKARFCVEGRKLLYDFCTTRNIPVNKCGKLIVATKESQWHETLPRLRDHALQNGVHDIKLLSAADVRVLEPQVQSMGALASPSTGVLDSHAFMLSLLADAQYHNATLALSCGQLEHATVRPGDIRLCVDGFDVRCDSVVNCAGLSSDKVASMLHQDGNSWNPPKQYFAKGNYFRLEGVKSPFSRLVYPVPEPGGLGVHATIDWTGSSTKFGPDVEWIPPSLSLSDVSLDIDATRAEAFYGEVRKYWPSLPDDSIVPDYAGLRPKLSHPNVGEGASAFVDFQLAGPKQHGIDGLFHLFGIESPGLTSSMAIANYIAERL